MGQGQASVPAEVRQGRFLALALRALAARRAAAAHAVEELLAPLVDVKVDVLPKRRTRPRRYFLFLRHSWMSKPRYCPFWPASPPPSCRLARVNQSVRSLWYLKKEIERYPFITLQWRWVSSVGLKQFDTKS